MPPKELDRTASDRSSSTGCAPGPLPQQLRSMHEKFSESSRKADVQTYGRANSSRSVSVGVDSMLSVMRQIPCWDSGSPGAVHQKQCSSIVVRDNKTRITLKMPFSLNQHDSIPGPGKQAAPSKAALGAAGASLMYHMEALPDERHAAWKFSECDAESIPAGTGKDNGQLANGTEEPTISASRQFLLACRRIVYIV